MDNCWNIKASNCSLRTENKIRNVLDHMKIQPNPKKPMLSLSIGDPTVFGNLSPPDVAVDALTRNCRSGNFNGYAHGTGYSQVKEAIARHFSLPEAPLLPKDVVITSGCSGALEMAITVLANPENNILLPRPGFPLYGTIAGNRGIAVKYYNLQPENLWEIDLAHLESLIDENTSAIVVNNPSNPCGSVYTLKHLKDILQIAERRKLPIIADEIYADMVFQGSKFFPLASLSKNVPILTCGGIAKQFLIPGWRQGWILIHDRNDCFKDQIYLGLNNLTGVLVGSCTVVQSIIPDLLSNQNHPSFFCSLMKTLQENALFSHTCLAKIPGIVPILPQGAMYLMFALDLPLFENISSDVEFCEKLIQEQSVFCLPGKCFGYPNYCRIVYTAPKEKLEEAFHRIQIFCNSHRKK